MSAHILPFIVGRSFDEATTAAMGLAYDKTREMMHDKEQPLIVREIIAKRIIDIAATGERDPDELARRALLALGMNVE